MQPAIVDVGECVTWRAPGTVLRLALSMLLLVSAGAAGAQNLIVNAGFENNPPPNFGNNYPYPITPWVVGAGNAPNVVKVDGGASYNYGNGGPALDADPVSGAGVRQHYLDIAAGSNDFYQAFIVPTCGAAPGERQATFSGYFSTRDNLSGTGRITIRTGTGLNGTVLASAVAALPAPVFPATSGNSPWTFVSGTVTVTAGSAVSYVVAMDNNVNFDQASLTFNDVTCVTSQLTLRKVWSNAIVNDTATVNVSRGATQIDSLTSTVTTANQTDTDATPVTVFAGEQLTLAEVLGASNGGTYNTSLSCTGNASLSGSTLTVGSTSNGAITCTYANNGPGTLQLTKVSNGGAGTFAYTHTNTTPATSNITTTASGGAGTTGSPLQINSNGAQIQVTEAAMPGWRLDGIACTRNGGTFTYAVDLTNRRVTIPSNQINANSAFACTFTNSVVADLAITKSNTYTPTQPSDLPGDSVVSGTVTTYTLVVTNNAVVPVTGAVVTDPPGTRTGLDCPSATIVSCSGAAGVCPGGGTTLATLNTGYTLGTLAASGTAILSFSCTVN